jgi:glutathione S-transferase
MAWIELVSVLALLQYLVFGFLVAKAHVTYGVKPPAMAGNELFDRVYRVQMNTLEQLVAFLPALWLASRYWSPAWIAALGAVYLVGRMIYRSSYVKDPDSRTLGFVLTIAPTAVLLLATLVGAGMALLKV